MRINLSVARKISITVSTIILVMGLIAVVTVFLVSRSKLLEMKDVQLRLAAEVEVVEAEQIALSTEELLKNLGSSREVVNYFEKQGSASAQTALETIQGDNIGDRYSNIYLLDNRGIAKVSIDPSLIGNDYSFRAYFREAIGGKLGVEAAKGVTSLQVGYYFAYPVRVSSGQIAGVVVVKMKPEVMDNIFDNSREKNASWMLTDESGIILQATKKERIFKSLGSLDQEDIKQIESGKRFAGIEISSIGYDEAYRSIKKYYEVVSYNFYDKADGEEEKIIVQKVGQYPFFIILEEETEDILAGAFFIALSISLLVGGCVFLAIIIINLTLGRLMSPLLKIRKAVEEVRGGNFNHRLEINSGDEFEDIASVFNEMVREIAESKSYTESEVMKRTEQLEKLNKMMVGRELKMIEIKRKVAELEGEKG